MTDTCVIIMAALNNSQYKKPLNWWESLTEINTIHLETKEGAKQNKALSK